jgi:NADPH:quinone reductase-like Zn-dependent oxidoreductase
LFSTIFTNARLRGISVGNREQFEHFLQAIETTKLKPVIDKVFAFDQALEAFAYFNSGAHVGKVVIKL